MLSPVPGPTIASAGNPVAAAAAGVTAPAASVGFTTRGRSSTGSWMLASPSTSLE